MAHYAQVENGIVTNVIVVNDTDTSILDILGGQWVKTSYNTRANVHYGPDGQPDGGVALRKNYAGIGFTYDQTDDAFYPPKPSNLFALDRSDGTWKLKPEWQNVESIPWYSELSELPTASQVDGVDMPPGILILFVNVTNPGVYRFDGTAYVFVDKTDKIIQVYTRDPNEVFSFVDGAWRQQIVASAE